MPIVTKDPSGIASESQGFLRGKDVAVLAQRLHQPPYQALWAYVEQRTHAAISRTLQNGFADQFGALASHSRTPMLLEAALLVRLNHDPDALAYILACVDFVTQFKTQKKSDHLLHSAAELAMACDMVRGQLPGETSAALCRYMRETAIPFIDPDPAIAGALGSNVRWAQMAQTACCALLWGETAGVVNWRLVVDQGVRATRGYLLYGADAQGHSYEGTGYGQAVLRLMFPFVELLKLTGYVDLYTTEPGLAAATAAALHSLFPDRSFLTNDNDHGLAVTSSMAYLLLAHRALGDPVHLALWHAYQGPDHPIRPWGDQAPWNSQFLAPGTHNFELAEPSLFLACLYWDAEAKCPSLEQADLPVHQYAQGTGKALLRTSWSPDATFHQLLGSGRSHMSQTHRHADAGHFSIFAHGEYLAIDTGRYNSDEDQHSVPLVAGECFAKVAPGWGMDHHQGRLSPFVQHDALAYTAADMAQIKGCYWATRHFLVINHDQPGGHRTSPSSDQAYLLCVDDLNKNNEPVDLWWQLQAHPDCQLEIAQPKIAGASQTTAEPHAVVRGKRARLDVHFALPLLPEATGARSPMISVTQDVKDWQWPYGKDQKITGMLKHGVLLSSVQRPRLIAQAPGSHGVLMSVISPRRQDEPALPVTSWQASRQVGVRIDLGPYIDTILAAPSHGWLSTPRLSAMTELLWYRQDKNGKVLSQWTLDDSPIQWKK
jgi:hypothetical protein